MVVRIEVFIQCSATEKTQGTENFISLIIYLINGIIFALMMTVMHLRFDISNKRLIQMDNASFCRVVSTASYHCKIS